MDRHVVFAPAVLAITMSVLCIPQVEAQVTRQQQKLLSNAREASKSLEGTWVLQQRLTPSGKPHKQPLKGEFTVKLPLNESAAAKLAANGLGTLATGSYEGLESGVLDSLMSEFSLGDDVINPNPTAGTRAAPAGDVLFEMKGSSQLAMDMNINSPDTLELVFRNLELKGSYGVFRQGVRGARVPTTFKKTDNRFLFFKTGSTLSMTNTVGAADLEIARGARGPGSPTDKSHEIVKHVVHGDRMDITYGNGGRDVWVRRR